MASRVTDLPVPPAQAPAAGLTDRCARRRVHCRSIPDPAFVEQRGAGVWPIDFPHAMRTAPTRPGSNARALPAAVMSAAFCGGCTADALLTRPLTLGMLIGLLAAAVVLNAAITAGLLLAWERWSRRRRLRETLRRELRHLGHGATEEAVLRKAGLLRDLNALGDVPDTLDGCVLTGAALNGVRLSGCSLRGANLAGAQLQGAVLDRADLFGADLTGANLALASLRGANLRGCTLARATLAKAVLDGANLHRADLVNADLRGAGLQGTRLSLARFARPGGAALQFTVHPSVEDWIRARLDADGRYREGGAARVALPEAG